MRIVISTAVYYPMINGVAVFSHNLAVGLAERGHEVLVLTPSQTKKSHTEKQGKVTVHYLRSADVKIYPDQIHENDRKTLEKLSALPGIARDARLSNFLKKSKLPKLFYKNGFKVSLFPKREVNRILREFQPDVIHIQVSDPIGLSVATYARVHQIPIVTTEHNEPEVLTDPLKLPNFIKKPANLLLSSYFRDRQSRSDYVTMPTELAISHLFSKGKPEVPVEAVSNGVDLSAFRPGRAPRSLYEKYGLPQDRPTVLYVGRVDPEKQVGKVLESFAKVLEKLPKAIFVVVGDGVDRENLVRRAKLLGVSESVYFLGRVLPPDLYELYKIGDVFSTASEIETQGIVLIEAAATGLPLVAVDGGAVAEICRNGENGFLLAPGDIEGMARALFEILSNPQLQAKFSSRSLELARAHDFSRTLDKFEEIYRKVIRE